jgi:SAM-dependent methyltransferase
VAFEWKPLVKSLLIPPLDAVDRAVRSVMGPHDVPPFRIRVRNGAFAYIDARRWIRIGNQMRDELRTFVELRPEHDVLEIGCGPGIAAHSLKAFLGSGSYTGLDIDATSIAWCRRNYAGERTRFVHQDLAQAFYNPGGSEETVRTPLPFGAASFDRAFTISVFTHLYPDEISHYLSEISRVLRPGGSCLATLLIKDRFVASRSRIPLRHEIDADLLAWNAEMPTKALAHSAALLARIAENGGMRIREIAPGSWDGTTQASYFHDMIVFEPRI